MSSDKSLTLPFAQQPQRQTSRTAHSHTTRPAVEQIEAYRQLSRAIRDAGDRVDLGQLQIEVLYLLHERGGPVKSSRELLPILAVRMSTLSEATRALYKKSLISYIPHDTDKRRKEIQISALGRQRVRQFFRHFEVLMQHQTSRLV